MDRDTVVRAALKLLDEVGLAGLSLRRLAKDLGVQAPTLYWYFKGKQELLDQMAAAAMNKPSAEPMPEPGDSWDAWLAWMARGMRQAMLAHRDGALLVTQASPPDDQWDALEIIVAALVKSGFTPVDAIRGIGTLTNFVTGTVLEEQQRTDQNGLAGRVDPATHPTLAAAVVTDIHPDQRFEHGLTLILAGMAGQLRAGGGDLQPAHSSVA
ncbi:TetR/AcrR family transcriptional regulator C-terminal domain-containing protein [Actinoplanes sp. NPDC049548]|uniref:TetR/AcrR family transcriptional regulator C-terminal domain-containing protein n=1 Tax=Actinoplanes sp. NPDC049548 TaxID=3155152 RepID=UPI003417C632